MAPTTRSGSWNRSQNISGQELASGTQAERRTLRALLAGFNLSFSKIFWDCALEALILSRNEGKERENSRGSQAGRGNREVGPNKAARNGDEGVFFMYCCHVDCRAGVCVLRYVNHKQTSQTHVTKIAEALPLYQSSFASA